MTLSNIFENKLDIDDRIASFTFTIGNEKEETWGIFMPNIAFWIQLLILVILTGCLAFIGWSMTYYFIIPHRGTGTGSSTGSAGSSSRSIMSNLVGFGIILPFIYGSPIYLLSVLDIRNCLLRFVALLYAIVGGFHTIEAMYGYSPKGTESSYKNYMIYNACLLELQYDRKKSKNDDKNNANANAKNNHTDEPMKASLSFATSYLLLFVKHATILGLYLSIFSHGLRLAGGSIVLGNNFEPFHCDIDGNNLFKGNLGEGIGGFSIFNRNLFLNNTISAVLFQFILTTFSCALAGLVGVVFGLKTIDTMKNPMFESTSVSDFWGRRWNLIVHFSLKRGVFKPTLYHTSSKLVAVLVTFLASGLFHEYILYVVFPEHLIKEGTGVDGFDYSRPSYGNATAFMMWNAILVIMEFIMGGAKIFQWMKHNLPKPLMTALVLSTAIPTAHWFIHPYTNQGFFQYVEIGLPMIKRIQ